MVFVSISKQLKSIEANIFYYKRQYVVMGLILYFYIIPSPIHNAFAAGNFAPYGN